jgi:tRNA A-37 threonylcarbamoyl transferase component Bud32
MKIVIHPDFANTADFIRQLPKSFEHEGELLYDKRNKVKRYRVNNEVLTVKRYKRPNVIQRIVYTFFKKSKTERAYLFAGMLRERGFDTPHEVAYIEQKRNGLFLDGYFVSLNCDYPPLSELLRKRDFDRQPANELAAYMVRLHEKGVLHGDLNLTNILYHTDDKGSYQFTLIDTNRSKFKSPTKKECLENLKRLTHSKALLRYIVMQYAISRGWNPRECALEVFRYLLQFEQKRHRKRKLQSWIGIKK